MYKRQGDFLNAFLFFQNVFIYAYNLLNQVIDLGGGIKVSLFGIFIGVALLSLVFSVIRKLYD